jgi:DNA-binding NtrC family response regulator
LSTAYGIARQAGGWIDVRSTPGEGACFEVWLPVTQPQDGPAGDSGAERASVRGDETLLVVEDQADVRRLTMAMLKASGYRLLEAANGEEALRVSAAFEDHIDLLVTDVIMPGLNGRQLAERLEARRPGMKTLYISGYTSEVRGLQGSLDPGMEYLRKPFGAPALTAKVREVLERRAPECGRILVIDDDTAVRGLLRHILSGAGHTVLEAADGKAGMAEIERRAVDLVITDLVMPEQEGLDVLLKLHAQRPGLPVIAISGAFGGSFLKVAERFGAVATLGKPVDADALLRAVRAAMASRLPR